ncbi:hypothetical protein ACFLW1_01580 [Chloroflexota bacterium]
MKGVGIIRVVLLAVVLTSLMPLHGMPANGVLASEGSMEAGVTVTGGADESYGGSVISSQNVLFSQRTLGEPDGWGAYLFREASLVVEMENVVADCEQFSVWAARRSFWSPRFDVYVSADGASWNNIGSGKCKSVRYTRFDFTGSFGEVRYVWINLSEQPRRFNMFALDAVWAKGGGS